MKNRWILLLLVLSLFSFLFQNLALAQTLPVSDKELSANSKTEIHTIVPEGVTEIDLRVALGDDVYGVYGAWMLNEDVCVILRELSEEGDNELIVLDTRDNTILSRSPILNISYMYEQGWEDGVFYLLFGAFRSDDTFYYVKTTVTPDGKVMIDTVPSGFMVMPGGKTAVREAEGSLYAVDQNTYKEELLIQGVPSMTRDSDGASYETYLKYVPCPDDIGYCDFDEDDKPLPFTFPVDEDEYYSNSVYYWRDFYVYKPLDEYRFAYTVGGWECGAGYGVYDLKTHTNHRITGIGDFFGMEGNTLYGSALRTDVDTLESSPLPISIQDQFGEAGYMEEGDVECDISPDGRLLALTGMKSRRSDASTVTITDIQTGSIIKSYDIYNPFAVEFSVSFYGDTRFMVFFYPKEHGSAYIYLFDVAE